MTNCVLQAYKSHLYYLGIESNSIDEAVYHFIKGQTHDLPAYTFGGIVPLMLTTMAFLGHRMEVEIQHTIWSKNHYCSLANDEGMSAVMKFGIIAGNFQKYVDPMRIALKPAIYLMNDIRHAVFDTEIPDGIPVMAIQLVDKLERSYYYDRTSSVESKSRSTICTSFTSDCNRWIRARGTTVRNPV